MPQHNIGADYHAQPAEANHSPEPLADDFAFVSTQPAHDPEFDMEAKPRRRKANRSSFRKGHDPRRHKFTPAECSAGFWSALAVWGVGMGQKLHASGRWPNYRRSGR